MALLCPRAYLDTPISGQQDVVALQVSMQYWRIRGVQILETLRSIAQDLHLALVVELFLQYSALQSKHTMNNDVFYWIWPGCDCPTPARHVGGIFLPGRGSVRFPSKTMTL